MKHDSIRSYKENGSIFRRESPRYQSLHEGICLRKNNRRGRKSESGAAEAGGGDSSCA